MLSESNSLSADTQDIPTSTVFIVCGPSGAGKGTIISKLKELVNNLQTTVSTTTRNKQIRNGQMEQNGIAYNFVSNGVFDTMINEGQFLESAEYAGSKYGTPISAVDSIIQAKEIPLLEIELNGATQARKKLENIGWRVKVIFVMNSTLGQTRERLISRGGQDEEKVNQRMMRASEELSQSGTITDIYILNDVNDAGQSAALAISHIINTSTQKK